MGISIVLTWELRGQCGIVFLLFYFLLQVCFTPLLQLLPRRAGEGNVRIEFVGEWGDMTEENGVTAYGVQLQVK